MKTNTKKNYIKKLKNSRKNKNKNSNSKKTRKYSQRSGMMRSSSINRVAQSSKNVARKVKDIGQDIVTEVGKEQIKTGVKMAINPRKSFPVSSFTPMKKQINIDKDYSNKLSNVKNNKLLYSLDLDEYDTYKTPKLAKNNINFGETSPEKFYGNEDNYNMNNLTPYQKTRELNTIKKNLDFDNED
jgi:hypothetical protein